MSRMSENVGASTSRNPKGLHGLHGENFTLHMWSFEMFALTRADDLCCVLFTYPALCKFSCPQIEASTRVDFLPESEDRSIYTTLF
jgi:hypothetical protein